MGPAVGGRGPRGGATLTVARYHFRGTFRQRWAGYLSIATAEAARLSGWHLGQTVPFGAYTVPQVSTATFNPLTGEPHQRFSAKLVGIVVFSSRVVDDDVDRFPTTVLMTPAITRRISASATYPTYGPSLRGDEVLDGYHLGRGMRGAVRQDPAHEHVALEPAAGVQPVLDARTGVARRNDESPRAVG